MPWRDTTHFGRLEYDLASTIHFGQGLPGFDSETEFVLVQQPHNHPLVFLQSIKTPDLCFPALPVRVVEPDYQPCISAVDLESLGFVSQPEIGHDAIILALIAIHDDEPTANLLAPIVVNLRARTAAQCIDAEMRYSHRRPLTPVMEAAS